MGFANYLTKKLVGYDILKSEQDLKSSLISAQNESFSLKSKLERLEGQNRSKQGTIMNHVKKINTLANEIEALNDQLKQYSHDHDDLLKIREELSVLKKQRDQLEIELKDAKTQNDSLTTSNAEKEKEIQDLDNQILTNREIIKEKDREIIGLEAKIKEKDLKYEDVFAQFSDARKEQETLSIKYLDSKKKNSVLLDENEQLKKQIQDLKEELQILKESNDSNEEGSNSKKESERNSHVQEVVKESKDEQPVEIEDPDSANSNEGGDNPEMESEEESHGQETGEEATEEEPAEIEDPDSANSNEGGDNPETESEEESHGQETDIEATEEHEDNSEYVPRLTMKSVWDVKNGKEINAYDFFKQPESEIIMMRRTLQTAIIANKPVFVCPYCHQMVKISGKRTSRGRASFFSHLYDSDACMIKTTTGLSKEQIEASKYGLVAESERHIRLKNLIAEALNSQMKTDGNISDVQIEKRINSQLPYMRWRRPDVQAKYKQYNLVFELQLSTTFISTIVDRDLFYRLNNFYIIWVFNFDDNQEYVNLSNLMCKDIYYANKRNVFVFDEEAQEESVKRGKLCLKCNWLDSNNHWHFSKEDAIIVTLDDLKYDLDNKKPFYFDADEEYFKKYPELLKERRNREITREEIISALLEKERLANDEYEGQSQERRDEAQKEMLRTGEVGTIYKKGSNYGLSYNGTILVPAKYTSISEYDERGYATIQMGRFYKGLIDKLGNIIVPCEKTTEIVIHSDNSIVYRKGTIEWYMVGIKEPIATYHKDKVSIKTIDERVDCITFSNDSRKYTDNRIYIIDNELMVCKDFSSDPCRWVARNLGGEIVKEFDFLDMAFQNGRIFVKKKSLYHYLCGILDYSFEVLLSPIYDGIESDFCYDGAYLVRSDWQYGVISQDGSTILDCEYSDIKKGANCYIVGKNKRYGILDSSYKPILQIVYSAITVNNDSFIVDKDRRKGLFRKDAGFLLECDYQEIRPCDERYIIKKEDKWAVVDKRGCLLTSKYFDYQIKKASSNYVYVIVEDNIMRLFDYEGKRHVRKDFYKIEETAYQLFVVRNLFDNCVFDDCESCNGIADDDGNLVIPCDYYRIVPWGQHCFKVTTKKEKIAEVGWGAFNKAPDYYYLIDYENHRIGTSLYSNIGELVDGKALAERDTGEDGFLDENGKEIASDSITMENGFIKEFVFGHWRVCSLDNKEVVPAVYKKIELFSNGLYKAINVDDRELLIDYEGNPKTKEYISIGTLIDGVASADDTFLNAQGEECFQTVTVLSNGNIIGKNHNKYCLFNKDGDAILKSGYDSIELWGDNLLVLKSKINYYHTYNYNNINVSITICDYDGLRISDREYSYIGELVDGKFKVICREGSCMIDLYGKEWPIEIEEMPDGNIICTKFNKYGVCNKNGNILVKIDYNKVEYFCHGIYKVEYSTNHSSDKYYELINAKNENILHKNYSFIGSLKDGLFDVRDLSGHRRLLDLNGVNHSTSEMNLTSDITIKKMYDLLCVERNGVVVADYGEYNDVSLLGAYHIKAFSAGRICHLFNLAFEKIYIKYQCNDFIPVDGTSQIIAQHGIPNEYGKQIGIYDRNSLIFKITYGVVDAVGNIILPIKYKSLTYNSQINGYIAQIDDIVYKYSLYRPDGQYYIEGEFNKIVINDDGTIKVSLGDKNWCYDSNGDLLKNKKQLDNGLYLSEEKGLYGIEDTQGDPIIPCENDCITTFEGEFLCIKDGEIHKTGIKQASNIPFSIKVYAIDSKGDIISHIGNTKFFLTNDKIRISGKTPDDFKVGVEVNVLISRVDWDRNEVYLRLSDVQDLLNGTILDVVVISKYIHGIIAKLPEGGTVFIHHSMYSPDLADNIENGTSLRIKKVGYDEEHKKYIWEVL